MIPQRVRSHEQPYMAARYGFLDDAVLCGADIFRGIEDLFRCRDVIVCLVARPEDDESEITCLATNALIPSPGELVWPNLVHRFARLPVCLFFTSFCTIV